MIFFFTRDFKHKYRYFSTDPARPAEVHFSKSRRVWELAKKKLMLLPHRTLRQEQAFERALKARGKRLPILYSRNTDEEKIRFRFSFFLQKQRTTHILILAGEAILLPFTGLAALLPGPNILFYALALLIITQWLALRGINRTIHAEHEFIPDGGLAAWEEAAARGETGRFGELIDAIEREHGVKGVARILGRG